jgi:ribosomal protein L11 methyltransferase
LDERPLWPALTLATAAIADTALLDRVSAVLDDYSPVAIEDLTPQPLPPGGLWDPTYPPIPDPPPAPLHWRVFFTSPRDREAAGAALRDLGVALIVDAEDISDDDWAARSQRALTAVEAGSFIVAPPWALRAEPGKTTIVIEPSRGFGTGHHASTRLCLRALSDVSAVGRDVLDLGTGSGVLALAASLSGARAVLAVDVDPDAIDSARASHALNPHAGGIDWLIGDFRNPGWAPAVSHQWDVVLANLTGGMLRSSAARIRELVAAGGRLIVSGFDTAEQPAVEQALAMTVERSLVEETWVGLTLRPRNPSPLISDR